MRYGVERKTFAVESFSREKGVSLISVKTWEIYRDVSQTFFAHEPLLASKNNHRSSDICSRKYICPEDMYGRLQIYISQLILDRY
jgi:hypothetical protein